MVAWVFMSQQILVKVYKQLLLHTVPWVCCWHYSDCPTFLDLKRALIQEVYSATVIWRFLFVKNG